MYKNYTNKLGVPNRHIVKIWLIMRLTTVILIATIMQVSATGFAQKISLSRSNAPLKSILKELKTQSGYNFVVTDDQLSKAKPVNIKVTNLALEDVLNQVFSKQPLNFSIESKTVIVIDKEEGLLNRIVTSVFTNINIKGVVVDSTGKPLANASVKIKGRNGQVNTNINGEFYLFNIDENATLVISYIGFVPQEVKAASLLTIVLKVAVAKLNEVAIASNGYQDLPKERSTGSFEVITAQQLKHSSSGNLLQRLEGITTSIVFNNTASPNNSAADVRVVNTRTGFGVSPQTYTGGYTLDNMTIRGKNTLSTNGSGNPLVVIDGVANPYDISLINPDDVVSITILKDAAAASIWGSRAANGVLVIKTKRGEFNQQKTISFNGNFSITDKPDLFYLKQMSASDYIDAEIYGFQQANTSLPTPDITEGYTSRLETPVTEILDAMKKGTLSQTAGNAQIAALRNNDIRKDQTKYLLRNAISQNYSLNTSGGSKNLAYTLGGGYQKLLNNTVKSNSDRINLNYNMQFRPVKNLDISSGISYYVTNKNSLGPLSPGLPFSGLSNLSPYYFPYSKLADDDGNALAIPYYRPGFINALNTAYGNKILDYTYKPLDDINESYSKATAKNLNFNVAAKYDFSSLISAQLTYNYNLGTVKTTDYYSGQSIYMRDLINRYTNPVTFARSIPLGGFYNPGNSNAHNQTVRGLVSFNKNWNSKHDLNAIIGAEVFDSKSVTNPTYGYYGYDPVTLKAANVTYNTYFNTLFDPNYSTSAPLPNPPGISFLGSRSRTVSEFFNAAYTYDKRYTVSGSVRKDGSSAFGDDTNKTGTPFYSVGASWNINAEKFYNVSWLPYLKLRSTFGYNGNANSGPTSYARISVANSTDYRTNLPYARVDNLSNSQLRPERTAITNIALDFGFKDSRLTGSLEYFVKKTKDLLSFSVLDPSLGFNGSTYNVADLKGEGVDLRLRSVNLKLASFTWESNFNLSYNRVKVTKNYVPNNTGASTILSNNIYYYEGKELSVLYAYQWAGLNPTTGAARVVSGTGLAEVDYSIPASDLKDMKSAVPVYFGNLANTFSYAGFSLWANVIYKLGYSQRRPVSSLFLNGTQMSSYSPQQVAGEEYVNRWKKAGDEVFTNVPSRNISRGQSNDNLYRFADINVYKADNIRIQEINLSYSFLKNTRFIKNPRIYFNMPLNIMLWKANKLGLDPDIFDYPVPKTYTVGFSANF